MTSVLLLVTWLLIACNCNSQSIEINLNKCVDGNSTARKFQLTKANPYYLSYSDSSVEILSILGKKEIASVKQLAKCIQQENQTYMQFNLPPQNTEKHIGYGNITTINGLLKSTLPQIYIKLVSHLDQVIQKLPWKTSPISSLGLRTIRMMSYDSNITVKSSSEIKAERKKRDEERRSKFVVYPHDPNQRKLKEHQMDEKSDANLIQYIQFGEDSVYTVIIPLVPRNDYRDGEIIVSKNVIQTTDFSTVSIDRKLLDMKKKNYNTNTTITIDTVVRRDESNVNNIDNEVEDDVNEDDANEVEEEEDEDEDEYMDSNKAFQQRHTQYYKHHKFHSLYTNLIRHTPDMGHAILIRSQALHGFQPISKGKVDYLILEYWNYTDVRIDVSHRLKLEEAKPLEHSVDSTRSDL